MKIIINTPILREAAGVSNHYLGLRKYFSDNIKYHQYVTEDYIKRKYKVSILYKMLRILTFVYDIFSFIILLCINRETVVLLNPSFGHRALKRDQLFLRIAKVFKRKVVVFIHGWDINYLKTIYRNENIFSHAWKKADAFFVLANEFKEYLYKLGIKAPIYLTTTKVDDRMVDNINENKIIKGIQNILFLARVEEAKGIITAIDTIAILCKKYPYLKLRVVGSGSMLEKSIRYAEKIGIMNVTFTGVLFGNDLITEYTTADLYLLPTTHGEGMPTTVLEAMAFGLPVITRPVGGLKDFFENGKMGYMIEGLDPEDYACKIELLINNVQKANEISEFNKRYAKEHFMASDVAANMEKILMEI